MKKIVLVFSLLITTAMFSQRTWSVEGGLGNTNSIADEVLDIRENNFLYTGVVRKQFNEIGGLGLYGDYSNFLTEDYRTNESFDTRTYSLSLQGVVSITNAVGLNNKVFNLLGHAGFGGMYFKEQNNGYDNLAPIVTGGFTGLFRIVPRVALKADISTTALFSQDSGFSGTYQSKSVGINSFVTSPSVGVVFYFGKSKSKSNEHYDFYEKPKVDELAVVRKKIQQLHQAVVNQKPTAITVLQKAADCNCLSNEYAFFDFDKSDIERSELAAIESAIEKAGAKHDITLRGNSCPRFGTDQYNMDLAKRRVERVKAVMIGIGFPENRIKEEIRGKDYFRNSNNAEIRASARRVDILIGDKK